MANHLLGSSSPYLLQHAGNPVDWYPWGEEALSRARAENKPIFLSIGYAACHWCHVMEHQCFENPEIAALMNARFINIKVDREERPDLDELYMLATQLMTGQGGWPMSVWLTPDLEPFYAGTYFPPADGYGRPGFPRLLMALEDAWQNRRDQLLDQARKVVAAIGLHADESATAPERAGGSPAGAGAPAAIATSAWIRLAIEQFSDRFDPVHGGLGAAPKFPPHQALQLWLALLADGDPRRTGISAADQRIIAGQVQRTLDAMKDGGIYDHVGGAFARYSTDAEWRVPHFEKMLYDSAQLAPLYAQASVLLERPDYARVAIETLDFFLREMRSPQGAFHSSLDADSDGEEGKYYVWTLDDIHAALPNPDDAALIIRRFNLTSEGNWQESPVPGGNILFIASDGGAGQNDKDPRAEMDRLLLALRAYRARRTRPGLDDKILTSWNGLMLSALAHCGRILGEERLLAAARQLASFLLSHHQTSAGLQRVSRGGVPAHTPGFLDDHAYLLNGLLDLMQALPAEANTWRAAAEALAQRLLEDFQDPQHGGFFFTGPRHEKLFCRMKNAADNATPSANGVAIRALLRLGAITGQARYADAALNAVRSFRTVIARRPEYFPTTLTALLEREGAPSVAPAGPSLATDILKVGPGATGAGRGGAAPAHLQLTAEPIPPVRPGEIFSVNVHLMIAPDYYIAVTSPPALPISAQVRALGADVLAAHRWHFPPPTQLEDELGYAGVIEATATCTAHAEALPGTYRLRVVIAASCCSLGACLPPERVAIDLDLVVL